MRADETMDIMGLKGTVEEITNYINQLRYDRLMRGFRILLEISDDYEVYEEHKRNSLRGSTMSRSSFETWVSSLAHILYERAKKIKEGM